MKSVIVVTGASSGFGLLAAQKLAQAGHIVYAGMREISGRNAPQAAAAPFGKRPFRIHIDPSQDGAEIVNGVADRVRAELLRRIGLEDVLRPRQ